MAEPESILQLGIEAAREGKKEEARQLFRLLTRQEPDNAQGWLWLAGVAENREERQNALERVLALDPDNEMALKGLQALGVRPGAPQARVYDTPSDESIAGAAAAGAAAGAAAATPPPPRTPVDREPFAEDDPFAELNNLSETMAADTSGPVRRAEPSPDTPRSDADTATVAGAAAAGAAAGASAARSTPSPRPSSRSAGSPRRTTAARADDDEYEAPRRGLSPLLGLLLFLVGLGLIGLLIAFLFPGLFSGDQGQVSSADQTAIAATSAAGGLVSGGAQATADPNAPAATTDPNAPAATADPNAPAATTDPNAPAATADPNAPVPTIDPNAPAATPDPNAPGGQPGAPPADVSQANPALVNANTPLQSEGWLYDFNQPTYAASIIGNLGQFAPNNGRFVVVLVFAVNNTGSPQPIPGNFFVLKDAQGRVWEARPDVSAAYVVPGVNADLAHTQPLPADGITRSVAIIFDVAPDATDLVFFARSNPAQGWLVLRSV